jgi:hypothetical protein
MKQVWYAPWVILLALGGCADSGSASRETAGIEGTGDRVASGAVTAFGSIWVNGIRFDTDNAEILMDDETAAEEDLQPGMVVDVQGEIIGDSSGRAERVHYAPLLRGPIAEVISLAANRKQVSVLGQLVLVAEDAVFSGLSFADLRAGLLVDLSGLRTADYIFATRIVVVDAELPALIQGTVTQLDIQQQRLALGDLWVDFSAAEFVGVSAARLALDQQLRITGPAPGDDGVLHAAHITMKSLTPSASRGIHALEGLVENLDGERFYLQGTLVISTNAQWQRGNPEDLAEGARLSLTGTMIDGALHASRITLLPSSTSRLRGQLEFIDPSTGAVQVLGNRFVGDALTAYRDSSNLENRFFALDDLRLGDFIEIHGSSLGDTWVATRIERLEDPGEVTLKGPIFNVLSETEIRVFGVTVDISLAEILGPDDLVPGRLVTVWGMQYGDDRIVATRLLVHEFPDCKGPISYKCGPLPPPPPRPGLLPMPDAWPAHKHPHPKKHPQNRYDAAP